MLFNNDVKSIKNNLQIPAEFEAGEMYHVYKVKKVKEAGF
jgi:hypothetical protein